MKEDKIRITYNEEKSSTTDSCPYWDYKISKDWLKSGKKIGNSYCAHPLIKNTELECHYGKSIIKVPRSCPLKEGQLVQKVELILAED